MTEEFREGEVNGGAKCWLSKVGIVEIYLHNACLIHYKLISATRFHNSSHGI